jgi:hypothetical protein
MRAIDATAGLRRLSGPIAVVLALVLSVTTCRLDKLINPKTADRLTVSRDSLLVSANLGSNVARTRTVLVGSADGVTLPWTATKTAAWITLSPPLGTAPDTLTVILHPDSLSQQALHRDTIVLTSTESAVTVRVPVAFDMLAPAAELRLSDTARADTAFLGSAQPDTFSLRIRNTGSLPLDWTAAFNAAWVTLSDSGGTVPPHDSTLTLVTLRPESLSTGPHNGTITFSASGAIGSPATFPIAYTIALCVETGITLDTIQNSSITLSDCGAPQRPGRHAKLYAVQATAGDTLSFRLTSAAFNAFLILTNSSGATVLDSTDACGAAGTACIINFPVTATARYVIEATTRDSGETGAFTLSAVRERAPSAPQSAGQFRKDSTVAIGVGAVTPQDTVVFKATLNDPNSSDSVRLEVEVAPVGSAFSNSATHQSGLVAVAPGGRTVAVRASGLSENTGHHWQARTCDRTGRCSAWLGFGNPDPAPDFFVNAVPETPAFTSAPNQFGPGGGAIPAGGGTGGSLGSSVTVTFRAGVTDPDPGDVILIEVEVKPNGTAFNGSGLTPGSGVSSGSIASVSQSFTVSLIAANYHWRAHACDQTGRCGPWVPFGSSPDFHVP